MLKFSGSSLSTRGRVGAGKAIMREKALNRHNLAKFGISFKSREAEEQPIQRFPHHTRLFGEPGYSTVFSTFSDYKNGIVATIPQRVSYTLDCCWSLVQGLTEKDSTIVSMSSQRNRQSCPLSLYMRSREGWWRGFGPRPSPDLGPRSDDIGGDHPDEV